MNAAAFHQLNDSGHVNAKVGDRVSWRIGKRRQCGTVVRMMVPGTSVAELRPDNIPISRWKYPKDAGGGENYKNDHRVLIESEIGGKKTYFCIPTHRIRQHTYKLEVIEK